MADTARKKSSNFDQSHASKEKEGVEKGIQSKQVIKGSKPPLPPRPAGLSKHPGKKKIRAPSKSPERPKEIKNKTEDHQDEGCHSPRHGHPPPSLSKGDRGEEAKTNEKGNVSTPQSLADCSTSRDGSIQQGSGPNNLDTSGDSKIECIPHVIDSNLEQLETSCVSMPSEEQHETEKPVTTNTKQLETADAALNQGPCLENTTKQKVLEQAKATNQKPARPENPKTVSIASSSEDVSTGLPKIPEPYSKPSSSKTPQTPERPKAPRIEKTPSVTATSVERSNSLGTNTIPHQETMRSAATPEKPKPPKFPKSPKVTPPVPPKPDSPRTERKSKSDKMFNKLKKPSPLVQRRTPKLKPPARPKGPEVAKSSEILKEMRSFDVETRSGGETASYSVGKTSSTTEITPQTIENTCAMPDNNGINEKPELSLEKNLPSNVNTPSEERKPLPHEEKPDGPVSSETSEEKTFGTSNIESRKDVKPSRPRAPSRKTESIAHEKMSENHYNSALSKKQNIPVKPTLSQQSGDDITHVTENIQITPSENKVETRASLKPSRPSKLSHDSSPLPENQNIPKRDIKPSRPRAPSRKTVNLIDEKIAENNDDNSLLPDNQTLPVKPAVDGQSGDVLTGLSQEPLIDTSKNSNAVASPKPSEHSKPKLNHDNSDSQNISVKPTEEQQSGEVFTHVTEDAQIALSKSKAKTVLSPRPARPSRPKLSLDNSDNQDIPGKSRVDQQSDEVFTHVTEHDRIPASGNKTETAVLPRPARPSRPKLSLDCPDNQNIPGKPTVNQLSDEVSTHVTQDVEFGTSENNKAKTVPSPRPARPSRPQLSLDNPDNRDIPGKPMVNQQSDEVFTHVTENDQTPASGNKTETVVMPRPARPSRPKLSLDGPDNQDIPGKPTVVQQSDEVCTHVTEDIEFGTSENNKAKTVPSPRPARSSRPKLSLDDPDNQNIPGKPTVVQQSDEVFTHEHDQIPASENKTEIVVLPRPARPARPKLSLDDPDNQNIPGKPTVVQQSDEVFAHEHDQTPASGNKTEIVVLPRPARPARPKLSLDDPDNQNIPGKPTVVQQSDEVFTHEHDQIPASGNKTETVAPPRPLRSSKSKHPSELSKASKNVGSHISEDANEHSKSLKCRDVDKPQRPSQPQLSNEPAARRESTSSSESTDQEKQRKSSAVIDHAPTKTDVSVKPQRPSKPKLPSELPAAEKTEVNSTEQLENISNDDPEALHHKNVTTEKPSRPARPNEMNPPHNQAMKSEKHKIENDPPVKKSLPAKPSRPPQPMTDDTSHDISTVKPQSSSQSTREETTKLARPPRPQAPHSGREKDKLISDEKDSVSVKTPPPKPQRTSMSENDNLDLQESQPEKEESILSQPTGKAKLEQNLKKLSQRAEESIECLNKNIVDEPAKAIVVKGNGNDSEEGSSGEQGHCEAKGTSNISARDSSQETREHSNSLKLSSPPPTSKTNCSQKEEIQNTPFIEMQRQSKDGEEGMATEMDKSGDQRTFRFRVSSLSKTEVESFNKKDFVEKIKNEKGRSRRKSEEESKSSTPPVPQPKSSRPRPPQPSHEVTQIIEKGEQEEKVEGHGTGSSGIIASGGDIARSDERETCDITSKIPRTVAGMGPGKEKKCPVEDIRNVSEALIISERKDSDVVSLEKTNTKLSGRKIKRKAPPEPRNTVEQRGSEEHLGIEGVLRNEQKMDSQDCRNTEIVKPDVKSDEGEPEVAEGQVESQSEISSANEQATVENVEKSSNWKNSTTQDLNKKQSGKNKEKVENNVLKEETATTTEHQMKAENDDEFVEPMVLATPVKIGTSVDKESPVVTKVSLVSESVPSDENVSRCEVSCTNKKAKNQQVCETISNRQENTRISHEPACNEPSVSSKDSEIPSNSNVEMPRKKKAPPPKPKRTSSLKRDSKLIVPKSEVSKDEQRHLAETEDKIISSPESLTKISEEKEAGKQTGTAEVVSNSIPKRPILPPAKVVGFDESTPTRPSQPSKPVSRSKSFAPPGKNYANETGAVNKDIARLASEGLSRSHSFGAKIRSKNQPSRLRPPTFYLDNTKDDESEVKDREVETGLVSEEHSDDVNEVEYLSSSQEDLVESETSQNHTKCDSLVATDSDSENEKEDEPQKSKTYYISREILSTERTFVDVMKLVSEDFMEAVNKGNKKFGRAIIPDETLHDIVLNISQIYKFDREFLKALEDRMETWDEEQRIGDIIKKFSPFLKMYKTYIQGYDNAMAILSDALKKHPQFAEVVREFECSERCQNLTVGMYMLKPIQRIPSYRLLLIDYLKHLSKDSLDYKDVSDALDIVSEVATHINEDMKRVDNFEEVLKVQRSLVGQVEIVKPGRELIKEGALMKLCRKDMQPRMFYLLTDVLLYTTPVANNQFRLNLSLPLEEIKVEIPVSPDFDNEFSIISTKKSFTLSASTAEERDEWLEALRNASDEIRKKKISFHLAKKEKMDALFDAQTEDDSEAKLGSKAPVWIPDIRVTMCMVCTDVFTVTNRRHHCRACGKVICGSCSSNSAPLAYLNNETARVCDICYDELTADKTPATQTGGEAKENGISSERKEPAPKVNPTKKKKTQKFKSKEVPAVEESNISGYLRTRVGKKWHKRWYVVKDNVLFASKASSDVAAQETRPLLGYEVRGPDKMDGDSKKIVFQLIHAGTDPVVLQTDNMKSAERWVTALRRATILPRE